MSKILFLDIDGVLNSFDWMWSHRGADMDQYGHSFDPRCVRWLEHIIEVTGCKIVISSSWRHAGISTMCKMWIVRKLPGPIWGQTGKERMQRGDEVQSWLDINKDLITSYCIVDDENDFSEDQQQFFVHTNGELGLTRETALKAIKILDNES